MKRYQIGIMKQKCNHIFQWRVAMCNQFAWSILEWCFDHHGFVPQNWDRSVSRADVARTLRCKNWSSWWPTMAVYDKRRRRGMYTFWKIRNGDGTEMEQSYTQRTPSCLMLLAYAEDRLRPRIVATGSMMALQWMSPSGRPTYCLAAWSWAFR